MTSIVLVLSMLFAQDKPAEKKPQVCWESLELYEDKDFTVKMAEDSLIATKYKEGMPKYVKKGKAAAEKMLAECGVELVECPNHRPVEASGIPAVGAEAKPLHLRILLAHDWDITTITLYAKLELYDDGKLIASAKSEKSVGWVKVSNRKKRQEAVVAFAGKIVKELSEKLKVYLKDKK